MKNSSSLKASASFLLLVAPVLVHAETVDRFQPKGADWYIESRCGDADGPEKCQTTAIRAARRVLIQTGDSPAANISYRHGLFQLDYPCGTACSVTYFFRAPNQVSRPFPLVGAVDAKRDYVISVESNPVAVYKIFGPEQPVTTAKLEMESPAPAASGNLLRVELVRSAFVLNYRDENGTARKAIIKLPR